MVKTYSAAAVFLLCRMKSPPFSLGVGVGILSVSLGGSVLTGIWPGERIVDKVSRFLDIEESFIDS